MRQAASTLARPAGPAAKLRFAWLDGARGFAAIAVMIYHFDGDLHVSPLFGSAFLAVDLFFLMSGFVLAYSYGARLRDGAMSFRAFVRVRCVRLYPVYLFGLMTGALYFVVKIAMRTDDAPTALSLVANLAANLFFVPSLTPDPALPGMFPFTPSAWSLSTEFFVSLLFGVWLCRLRTPVLAAITMATLVGFLALADRYGSFDLGWGWGNFAPGFLRNLFEFCEGVLAYRFVVARPGNLRARWLAIALSLAVAAALMWPLPGLPGSTVAVVLVFPLFIVVCARQTPGPRTSRLCEELGLLSYPLYLLHGPIALWADAAYKLLVHADPARISGRWFGLILVAVTLLGSWLVGRYVDEPVRRALRARSAQPV